MTTAEHEAAHVVAALLLQWPILRVDCIGDHARAGWVTMAAQASTFQEALRQAMVIAAPIALRRDARASNGR